MFEMLKGATHGQRRQQLEQRVGPEERRLFKQFLKQVNRLQEQQELEAQTQADDRGGG